MIWIEALKKDLDKQGLEIVKKGRVKELELALRKLIKRFKLRTSLIPDLQTKKNK